MYSWLVSVILLRFIGSVTYRAAQSHQVDEDEVGHLISDEKEGLLCDHSLELLLVLLIT